MLLTCRRYSCNSCNYSYWCPIKTSHIRVLSLLQPTKSGISPFSMMDIVLFNIFNLDCLLYQNKLQWSRRKNPPQVLPGLCLRVKRWMWPLTHTITTLWKLKMISSRRSVWWDSFTVFLFTVLLHLFEMSRWVLKVTVQSTSFRAPNLKNTESLQRGLIRRIACWGGRTWSLRLSTTSKS